MAAEPLTLFDFSRPDAAANWYSIDDVVMGGRSASRFEATAQGAAFTGTVSLANNGGFASVRSEPHTHDLGSYHGIVLRVRGDGKTYKLNLRASADFDGINYRALFTPPAGQWIAIKLPWSAFTPSFRGRPQPDAAPLDPARIVTFGLLIGDKQAGAFRLDVAWIGAFID